MSISIQWRQASDDGKSFETGTSSEYATLIEQFGPVIAESDVPTLRAMARAAKSEFYNEVADTIERVGAIKVWDSY
jgi:hypothetical protein